MTRCQICGEDPSASPGLHACGGSVGLSNLPVAAPSVVPGRGTPETPLDASIAGDVMGWESVNMPISNRQFDSFVGPYDPERGQFIVQSGEVMRRVGSRRWMPWSPSTDIAAAWEVVEKMREFGFIVNVEGLAPQNSRDWFVGFSRFSLRIRVNADYHAMEPSLPLAICLAAMKAVVASRRASVLAVDPSWSTPDALAPAVPSSVSSAIEEEANAARRRHEGRTT